MQTVDLNAAEARNTPMQSPIIFWFRQDLRLADHAGFSAAAATGKPLIPLYILDDKTPGAWRPGGASRWWLHHSLQALSAALEDQYDLPLSYRSGPTEKVLAAVIEETGADAVYCSRAYEPWAGPLEERLHRRLAEDGVEFKRFPGTLLWEPGTILNQSGGPFKVFTPFWRRCLRETPPALPIPAPEQATRASRYPASETLADWQLTPSRPDWAAGWDAIWHPGQEGAGDSLAGFLSERLPRYGEGRDIPGEALTSRLSPHLHYGEISPRAVWHAARARAEAEPALSGEADKFLSELGWREFSYHLLHQFPSIPEEPFKPGFAAFPWGSDQRALRAWQRGQTGYPIVDAGMRELWQTGYMHNRVRMVVASFLSKHLLLHWREGESWFWDTLVDADLASNSCSWQWVAGSGADAAPYFRIFNPMTQGEKFDGEGHYVRQWVPELAALPDKYLHRPFEAPEEVLQAADVKLGVDYPKPIVAHKPAREAALDAYRHMQDATR